LQANRDRIRLVLLDYFMPGMDPAACTRELCRLAGPTLVVLCTAAANPAVRAAEVGLSRWLAKPFEIEALERLVREAAPANASVNAKPQQKSTRGSEKRLVVRQRKRDDRRTCRDRDVLRVVETCRSSATPSTAHSSAKAPQRLSVARVGRHQRAAVFAEDRRRRQRC
jgi:DNA-binding NtrC family response regulator